MITGPYAQRMEAPNSQAYGINYQREKKKDWSTTAQTHLTTS